MSGKNIRRKFKVEKLVPISFRVFGNTQKLRCEIRNKVIEVRVSG